MEDPINSAPKSSFARFSQKLSSFIHRKTKDDSAVVNNNLYPRRDNKLYMSQPMLVLSKPTQSHIDADDVSDQSTSADLPSSLISYRSPLQGHIIDHARKFSSQSTFSNPSGRDSLPTKHSISAGTINVDPNSVPATLETSRLFSESIPNLLRPGGTGQRRPLSNSIDLTFEERSPPSNLSSSISTSPLPLSPTNGDDAVGPNAQVATSTLKFDTSADRPGRINMRSSISTLTDSNDIIVKARDCPSLQGSLPSKRERAGPKLTLNTTMDVNINGNHAGDSSILNTASSQPPFLPVPASTGKAPRLSLPPTNYRFSLNLVDGYSARMSPSVIIRPPPLPLLNLPVLPDITNSTLDPSSRRSKRAGLKSMPALPRHGSSRGTNGHEELDDVEDEEEEEEEEDADGAHGDGDSNGTPLEDEMDTPQSGNNTFDAISSHSRTPSASSYETVHESSTPHGHEGYFDDLTKASEKRFSRSLLPPVDISRIDLSFLDSPPLATKNKGKPKELTEYAGRTPIATRPNRRGGASTPAASKRMGFEAKMDTWAVSPVITEGGRPSSPIQTPRPGDYFSLPVITPPSPHPLSTRPTMQNRLSVLSTNTLTQFPGIYDLASKSLTDVYAMEKKEKVEQMVREKEEGAEEERRRRIKANRMSMRAAVAGATATMLSNDQQSDGQLKPSTPMRMSTSFWAEDDDPVKASEASSFSTPSPTAKQPKRSNNRISMAPAYETIIPLRRRLSMPTFNATTTLPPPYPDLFPNAKTPGIKSIQIQPRDDEGREKLPAYSNSIYIKAIMPRKLEFVRPGVQAKDRKWKRVLCVLEGTSLKVYKPPGVSVIGGWWENKVGVGDITMPTTTATSFNSTGGVQLAQGAGAGGSSGAIRKSKEDLEREREMMRYMMTTRPSQFNNATQRQGSGPASGSSYPNHRGGPVVSTTSPLTLFIPSSRGHARTISDLGQSSNTPSVPQFPRSSLDVPMNGRSTPASSFLSSRSQSPMFAASSSSSLTTPEGSSWSHRSTTSTTGGGATSRMATNRPMAASSSSSTSKGKKKSEESDLLPDKHSLIKAYTMQQAESGLGSDYTKRKNVIRVRLEGEQFLLQAGDVESVIEWIEGLQAATNIAMDLDERAMPRGPLFPRRRRRRRANGPNTTNAGASSSQNDIVLSGGSTSTDVLQLSPPLF